MNRVTFFCDGSCSGGTVKKPAPMGAGIVIVADTEQAEFSTYLGEGTCAQAELLAVQEALTCIPGDWDLGETHVTVWTDSAYAIGILTENWCPKTNLEIIQPLVHLTRQFASFQMRHVPGHSGHALNTRAHQLAYEAARSGQPRRPIVPGIGNPLAELLDERQARIDSLVQALRFYGDPLCHLSPPGADDQPSSIMRDKGAIARRVLAALGYPVTENPFEETA